ncbi:MAG: HAD-IA family hydrolase [Sphaerochaetaceae bacterium]|nr:HAD-IA family hydrolase [Sphaerochaetaceae bacterium]
MRNERTTPKAILFDLDGTLADTIEDITFAINAALESQHIAPITVREGKRFVGRGLRNALRNAALSRTLSVSESMLDSMMEVLNSTYEQHPTQFASPYDGAIEFLKVCQTAGITVGVLSNKDQSLVVRIVEYLFPGISFRWVQGAHERYPLKPDPTTVNLFMKQHSVNNEDLLFVGDSEVDALTSINAQVRGALVSWGFRDKKVLEDSKFSPIYDTFEELRKGELFL